MIEALHMSIRNQTKRFAPAKSLSASDRAKLKAERHALLLRAAPVAALVSLVLSMLAVWATWGQIAPLVIGLWGGAAVVLCAVRMGLWWRFSRLGLKAHALFDFTRLHVITMVINGILWGALGPIFAVHQILDHAFLPFALAGVAAASASTAGASWRAVAGFIIPALVPLAAIYCASGSEANIAFGMAVILYGAAMISIAMLTQGVIAGLVYGRVKQGSLISSLTEQLENADVNAKRFRALVEYTKDVTLIFSPGGKILYASPSAELALSRSVESLLGMTAKELVHPDDLPLFKSVGERSLSDLGGVQPLEHICFKNAMNDYVTMTGRLTNMLYVPGVEGFVFSGGMITNAAQAAVHHEAV